MKGFIEVNCIKEGRSQKVLLNVLQIVSISDGLHVEIQCVHYKEPMQITEDYEKIRENINEALGKSPAKQKQDS